MFTWDIQPDNKNRLIVGWFRGLRLDHTLSAEPSRRLTDVVARILSYSNGNPEEADHINSMQNTFDAG